VISKNVNSEVHAVQFAVGVKQRWRVSEQGVMRGIFVCMVEKVACWNSEFLTCTRWGIL